MKCEVYSGCYVDLFLGTAVSMSYVVFDNNGESTVAMFSKYLESATINYAELVALNLALSRLDDNSDYLIHTNSNYVKTVLLNCQTWRDQEILDQKAHVEQVNEILKQISRLGTGQITVSTRAHSRDEIGTRLLKHCKHIYHHAQTEMIKYRTTDISSYLQPDHIVKKVSDLPGSILWKKPMSMSVFQQKMEKSRNGVKSTLRLISSDDLSSSS